MLKPKSPQESFYGSYLYDRIVPVDHLLRKIKQVVDFSFTGQILKDRYNPDIGRPAEDPEFMLRLCLLQYIYGDSDRQVVENATLNLAYKYFLGLAVDAKVPDSDARMGKKTNKNWPGYKAHIIMEEESGIITGVETTPANATDGSQLKPMLKEQEEVHSIKPKELTADKAYDWGENLEALANKQTIANIALSKQVNHRNEGYFTVDDFLYDPENIKLMCPAGHISTNCYSEILYNNKSGYAFQFKASLCNTCPLKTKCVKNKEGRRIYISYYEPYFRLARERLATEEGQQAYRNRYKIEQKVADLARYCGLRRCRYRGLDRAHIHTLLATTVCNIKRMVKLLWGKPDNYYLELPVAV